MFSNATSPSLFAPTRRPERPPRPDWDTNFIRPPRRVESILVNNLNIAFSGLGPNHERPRMRLSPSPSLHSPTPSSISFLSSNTSHTSYSSSSMSSDSSAYHSSRSELASRHHNSDDPETTPKAHLRPEKRRSHRAKIPLEFASHEASAMNPIIHVQDAHYYTPRPSFDSTSSSDSGRSWLNIKERKLPPPPLQLNDSNLRPKKHHQEPPVIEIIAPGPPRGASRLSSYSLDPTSPNLPSPKSPSIIPPSDEEIRRRRHEKVMRTLGERVPPELVYRGRKIPNVTVFPEPPSPKDNVRPEAIPTRLARGSSLTLSSFSNFSSVTASLLASNQGRNKSRDLSDLSPSPVSSTPTPLTFARPNPKPYQTINSRDTYRRTSRIRPESVYSPIVFANTLDKTPTQTRKTLVNTERDSVLVTPKERDTERAAKLAKRASLSTATFLSSSPMRDGLRDLEAETPRFPDRRSYRPESVSPESLGGACIDIVNVTGRQRPESMISSPLVFARHLSLALPPQDPVDEGEESDGSSYSNEDDDDSGGTASPRPPLQHTYKQHTQSDIGHRSHSNPHLPFQTRAETPFQNSGVPVDTVSGFLAPPTSWKPSSSQDLVQRKERRQGWSGEWNQGDMQDVIKKLRNLK